MDFRLAAEKAADFLERCVFFFSCFSFACFSMGLSLWFSVMKCNTILEELALSEYHTYCVKLFIIIMTSTTYLALIAPAWQIQSHWCILYKVGKLIHTKLSAGSIKCFKVLEKCSYFTWTCGLLPAKTNTFPQYSVTVVRRVTVDKKLKYWKDVSWLKHCYDF